VIPRPCHCSLISPPVSLSVKKSDDAFTAATLYVVETTDHSPTTNSTGIFRSRRRDPNSDGSVMSCPRPGRATWPRSVAPPTSSWCRCWETDLTDRNASFVRTGAIDKKYSDTRQRRTLLSTESPTSQSSHAPSSFF